MGSHGQIQEGGRMKKLLGSLEQLDPACYAEIERGLAQVDIEYGEDIIQGACQRAVAARGWNWQVQSWDEMTSIAYVVGDGREEKSQADSPANALLTCYLKAIEAQP